MIRNFWEDAKACLIQDAPSEVKMKTSSGGHIDPNLTANPFVGGYNTWYDDDDDEAFATVRPKTDNEKSSGNGAGDYARNVSAYAGNDTQQTTNSVHENKPPKRKKKLLNKELFAACMEEKTIPSYVQAGKLLMECELPDDMRAIYDEVIDRLPVLQDAIEKFKGIYNPDMEQFYEYYIPEAMTLTATYLEYDAADIDAEILEQTKNDVMDAVNTLHIAINDKIDEIYKYATIELKAKAKALEAMMGQDGYVDPSNKI